MKFTPFILLVVLSSWFAYAQSSNVTASNSAALVTADLRAYGFTPSDDSGELRLGIFYLSKDRVAVFFEQPLASSEPNSHKFQLLVFNAEGQKIAQTAVDGNPKALDITAGPDGGIAVGREGHVEFYDSQLRAMNSLGLPPSTTGIAFDRLYNQLVIQTVDQKSAQQSANFLDAATLKKSATLNYPAHASAVLGKDQLVYTVPGECKRSAHVVSSHVDWQSIEALPLCDSLAFIENNELAYAFDGDLYVVDNTGKQVLKARIPIRATFQAPAFVGLSDDRTRLAISTLGKKPLTSGWPYYDDVLVYDLVSKRLIFRHALPQGIRAASLSPDGHQLGSIEHGTLILTPLP